MSLVLSRRSVIYKRARSFADLHFYQKWRAVWPTLAAMPRHGIRVLDAGCGDGHWAVEIASRRPGWEITGVDRETETIERARSLSRAFGLGNATFAAADFAQYQPAERFDVILSICSAHYGESPLETEELFQRMHDWLKPSGQILLLVPRCVNETPFVSSLAHPRWHDLFSREALTGLCRAVNLKAEVISPRIGRLGTVAKQLDWTRPEMPSAARGALGVLARGLAMVDTRLSPDPDRSLLWLLVARRALTQ